MKRGWRETEGYKKEDIDLLAELAWSCMDKAVLAFWTQAWLGNSGFCHCDRLPVWDDVPYRSLIPRGCSVASLTAAASGEEQNPSLEHFYEQQLRCIKDVYSFKRSNIKRMASMHHCAMSVYSDIAVVGQFLSMSSPSIMMIPNIQLPGSLGSLYGDRYAPILRNSLASRSSMEIKRCTHAIMA